MIGNRIRLRRKTGNLSLEQVAKRTGLSVGYLSNLERDLTSPTFENLVKICAAIGVNVVELISSSIEFQPVVKADERELVYSRDYHAKVEYMTDTKNPQEMTGLCVRAYDSEKEISYGHEVDEFGVVIKGSMVFMLDEETHVLSEGDSIYVRANTPHTWWKINEGECISYWTRLTERHVRVLQAADAMNASLEDQV